MARHLYDTVESPTPPWLTDTGRHKVADYIHEEVQARVPRWTSGNVIAAVLGLVGIAGAVGALAIGYDRTKEIPTIREDLTTMKADMRWVRLYLEGPRSSSPVASKPMVIP